MQLSILKSGFELPQADLSLLTSADKTKLRQCCSCSLGPCSSSITLSSLVNQRFLWTTCKWPSSWSQFEDKLNYRCVTFGCPKARLALIAWFLTKCKFNLFWKTSSDRHGALSSLDNPMLCFAVPLWIS